MIYTPNEILSLSINTKEHDLARQFALEQDTPQKGKQVYLNTLAILATHDLLEWLGIESDLEIGDSWNPAVRCFHDVADLVIPDLGIIECRPVLPGETIISLPVEVTEDRIAYIAVQFQEQLNEVQLLGFCPATDPQPEVIEIASLEPIETLIDYIDQLEESLVLSMVPEADYLKPEIKTSIDISLDRTESLELDSTVTNLHQWFSNLDAIYDKSWQKLDDFINSLGGNQSPRFAMGLRSSSPNPELPSESVRKAKEIDLWQNRMALIINCQQKNDEKTYIFIRLYPFLAEEIYLPSGVAIIILDELGNIFSKVQAGNKNKMLEMREFRGEAGENFTIKVTLGNMNYTENFVI